MVWCTSWVRPMVLGGTPAARCARIVATSRGCFDVTPSRTRDSATGSQRWMAAVSSESLSTPSSAAVAAAAGESLRLRRRTDADAAVLDVDDGDPADSFELA